MTLIQQNLNKNLNSKLFIMRRIQSPKDCSITKVQATIKDLFGNLL